MAPSVPLLSCESSVTVKKTLIGKKENPQILMKCDLIDICVIILFQKKGNCPVTARHLILLILLLLILLLINNDKMISLNRRIKTQFLFNISNELFCFSDKLSEITASIIKLHLHL